MIASLPGFEGGDRADHALLAYLHPASDPTVLQKCCAHEVLAPRNDAGGWRPKKFMRRIEHDVGASCQKTLEVILGGSVNDNRYALAVADLGEFLEGNKSIVDD